MNGRESGLGRAMAGRSGRRRSKTSRVPGPRARRATAAVRRRLSTALLFSLATMVAIAFANSAVLAGGRTSAAPAAEWAVVLGNAVADDGTPSPLLWDRLEQALALYHAGRVRSLLVTGDARERETTAMHAWLTARGVPGTAILVDPGSVDTYSSVWRARHVFGLSRVVIVTQRFHLGRAVWLARRAGLDADGVAADRRPQARFCEAREVLSRTKALFDVARGRTPARLPSGRRPAAEQPAGG